MFEQKNDVLLYFALFYFYLTLHVCVINVRTIE